MDLSVILTPAMQLLGTIALGATSALLTYGIGWVKKKTQLEDAEFEKVLADRANDIVHRGIQYALTTLENEAKKSGSSIMQVKVDNVFIRIALGYVLQSMPEIIQKFNLSQDRVRDMILARIGEYSGVAKVEGAVAPGPEAVAAMHGIPATT